MSKRYHLGGSGPGYRTIRESLQELISAPLARLRTKRRKGADVSQTKGEIWAIRDIHFDVAEGEVCGVIGRNGSGKSTLLKVLSRIAAPTEGYAEVRGRVGSLLEVGTGFHPELSGRENIFLNGAVLGMHQSEIRRKFDEIVAFAEVEQFLDTPVKHYSSGMHLRLAFAVAAHLEPEILLMDEVLAVGDAAFQRKCLGKMGAVAREGRTVLFVSHNMVAVRDLCTRAIWLDRGRLRCDGPVDEVCREYIRTVSEMNFEYRNDREGLTITGVSLRDDAGNARTNFGPGDGLTVEIQYRAERPIPKPYVILVVEGFSGHCFAANMLLDGSRPQLFEGAGTLRCKFASIPLLPQSFAVKMAIRASDGRHDLVPLQEVAAFDVMGNLEDFSMNGEFKALAVKSTSVVIPYEWTLPDGRARRFELKPAVAAGRS